MTPSYQAGFVLREDIRKWQLYSLIAGVLLLAASVAGAFFHAQDFFHAYLVGYLFWIGLALGALGFLMLQYLTGGAWGVVTRRILEAATRTLPLLAVLFIPIVFGLRELYDWAKPAAVEHSRTLQHRAGYMNSGFFIGRAFTYLLIWLSIAYFLNRWSVREERARQPLLEKLSAPGLILFLFSVSFASVDWAESLETRWSSSIWGFLFIASQGVMALAFTIIVMALFSRREPLSTAIRSSHFYDLGTMLFANLMLWAYFAFCQYVIVWSGNLPSEIHYYMTRTGTSWGWLGMCLIVVQFFIPAMLLLSKPLKRSPFLLSSVAILLLIMNYFDLIWVVLPSHYNSGFRIQWMDVLTPLGLGGVWLWAFLRELPRFPLLPVSSVDL